MTIQRPESGSRADVPAAGIHEGGSTTQSRQGAI